jgi:predicted nuclease with TOPRIM domain
MRDEDVSKQIESLLLKLKEAEDILTDLRQTRSKLESDKKINQDEISILDKEKTKEIEIIGVNLKKAEQLKMRSEKLYKEGQELVLIAQKDVEDSIPDVVKTATIEIPTFDGIQATPVGGPTSQSTTQTSAFGGSSFGSTNNQNTTTFEEDDY